MARTKREPEEILDEEYEQVLERVCAIDVAKEFGQVCVRTPRADGKRSSKVFAVDATTGEILKLGESLLEQGIEMVTLESTSDYWRIFYYLLEACGAAGAAGQRPRRQERPGPPQVRQARLRLAGQADRARDAAALVRAAPPGPGAARLHPHPHRPDPRPYPPLAAAGEAARRRTDQGHHGGVEDHHMSVRDMVDALIRGERNPEALADLARGVMRHKRRELVRALDGRFDDHHAELAKILLGQIDSLTTEIDRLTARIEQLVDELPVPEQPVDRDSDQPASQAPTSQDTTSTNPVPAQRRPPLQRLADIPGINLDAAEVILAEIGLDMSRFPTPKHLVSWARLSPRLIQSGNKRRGGKTSKGNPYLKGVLGSAAASASRTNTFLGERYRRIVKRRGKGKALVAVARSILVIVWHLLANPTTTYLDLGADYYASRIDKERRKRHLVQQLEALGLQVTLTPAAA